ncbi:MAG: carbohydrate binding family 9 domain-containing protein [Acidobacteria bacterium]|nr:carbohydrate binding family 9 domain-containing protein [Acidobacteriota bacterium]
MLRPFTGSGRPELVEGCLPLPFVLCLLALCLTAVSAAAQSANDDERIDGPPAPDLPTVVARDAEGRATIRTMRLPSPLEMDGRLDEPFYRDVNGVSDFVQQEPAEGTPATERTDMWVFFDDDHVYVGARMWESDKTRRVTSDMRRDSNNLYNNDHVAVLFDTFYDRRSGYFFYTNAQGGMVDAQLTNETPNNNWNGVWDVRTAEFEGGWTAEFRFPFRSVRFAERGHLWGVNFRRVVKWKNEISFLTPIPASYGRRGLTKISSAGTMVGIDPPTGLTNLDIKPYILGSTTSNNVAAPRVANDLNGEVGVDAKWAVTQSIVTDFTYNTDFAQVEDDEAQVNLTRFSLFFPEKREFFLEGQEYFNFAGGGAMQGGNMGPTATNNPPPSNTPVVFFSRRIGLQNGQVVPIFLGGRALARTGGVTIGALHMRTDDTPDARASETNFSVLRLNRDILSRSRVGVIATRRAPGQGSAAENYAYGADASFNLLTDLAVNAYWSGTETNGRNGDDTSYRGQFNWNADRMGLQVEHLYVGEDFNPEVGFLRRQAFRRSYGSARFSPRPAGSTTVRKLFYEGSYDYVASAAGRVESREAQVAFRLEFNSSDAWAFEYSDTFEALTAPFTVGRGVTVPSGEYSFKQGRLIYTLGPQRKLSGTLFAGGGQFYDGTLMELTWRGRLEFSPQLYAEPTISWNHIDVPWGRTNNNLFGTRLTYTLTPRMFVGALVQYQSLTASVSSNVRFRWEYRPGSELFFVYSDGRTTNAAGFPDLENRSVIVKATRLLRF